MTTLDLKPLNKETIQKMGYSNHDLWVVKISEDVFGPFEGESLKHYASENETIFVSALASRLDHNDWQPFFTYAIFSSIRKTDGEKILMSHEGPFWVLDQGQKTGPHSKIDIEKKIEMGILALSELISFDDGHSWQKVYSLEVFADKIPSSEALPDVPNESSFERAEGKVIDRIESQKDDESSQQSLATLMYLGTKKESTRFINLEEIDLKTVKTTEASRSLKLAIPSVFVALFSLGYGSYLLLKTPAPEVLVESSGAADVEVYKVKKAQTSPAVVPNPSAMRLPVQEVQRQPASVPDINRSSLTRRSNFRDRIPEPTFETHEPERYPENEPDPLNDPVVEAERDPSEKENSLVATPPKEDQDRAPAEASAETVDGAMDAAQTSALEEPPREQPVMEEASDF